MYLLRAALPGSDDSGPVSPQGTVPNPFSFALSSANATVTSGGSVKIVDSTTFAVSTTIAMAEVTVEPGAIRCVWFRPPWHICSSNPACHFRELHWHPTQDEWSFFLLVGSDIVSCVSSNVFSYLARERRELQSSHPRALLERSTISLVMSVRDVLFVYQLFPLTVSLLGYVPTAMGTLSASFVTSYLLTNP